jgi:hypothetical protein
LKPYGRNRHPHHNWWDNGYFYPKNSERQAAKKETEEQADEYIFLDWDTGKCDWSPPTIEDVFVSIEDSVYEQILLDEYLMTDFEEPNENNG